MKNAAICWLRAAFLAGSAMAASHAEAQSPADTGSAPAHDLLEQDAGTGQSSDTADSAETPSDIAPSSDIIVTGSRITRAGFQAPTPVTVARSDDLVRSAPSNLADALNQLPVFQGSISQTSSDVSGGNVVRSGNYLNLRSLGANRVLILQDGFRLPPSSNNGAVDSNLVPQMLIERVDVVTGGASAAYGSDAVSGVINYIVDSKFSGLKFNLQRGISSRGDDGSYRAGIAVGVTALDGRLRLIASAERYHSDGITPRIKRPGNAENWGYGGAGTAASPYIFYNHLGYVDASVGGKFTSGALSGQQFLPDGSLAPFNPGTSINRTGFGRNGDGVDYGPEVGTLIPALTTNQIYGRAAYDFGNDIKLTAQASWNDARVSDAMQAFALLGQMRVFNDNVYLTEAQRAALAGTPSSNYGRKFSELGAFPAQQRTRSFNAMVRLDGKIDDFNWQLGYSYGQTRFRSTVRDILLPRFYAALDAVAGPGGNPVCRITITNPGVQDGCIPIDTFGNGAVSTSAAQYFLADSTWTARNEMHVGFFNLSGDLFETWAGPVTVAVGGEYREQTLVQTSNSDPRKPVDTTGVRGVARSGLFWLTNVGIAEGSYNIKEAYVELNVPLLRDSAIGKSLEVNGAFRITDYSTSGSVETWKVGASYKPFDGLRFRGTMSRDIRAPSLFELFSGQTSSSLSVNDPLTGLLVLVPVLSGGNPDLKPERATTYTFGAIAEPEQIPGLSFSADYYDISISDAIAAPYGSQDALNLCHNSGGTDFACQQISRPLGLTDTSAANVPTAISITNINVGKLSTRGIDFELGYRTQIGGGNLSIRALATRLISYKRQQRPDQPVIEYAGTGDLPGLSSTPSSLPKWRATVQLGYAVNGFELSVQERMISGYDRSHLQVYQDNRMPMVFYTDLTVSHKLPAFDGTAELFLSVNNLFDRLPPFWPRSPVIGAQPPTQRTLYDLVGRYMTVGVRTKF